MKEPVKLRGKKLADGSVSLYLDIYSDGKRIYEFLKLYLVPEDSKEAKKRNADTLTLANAVKAQRVVELQTRRAGFAVDGRNVLLLDFYGECQRRREGHTLRSWITCGQHLADFLGSKRATLGSVDTRFLDGFTRFLSSRGISNGSINVYNAHLIACLREAENMELIARVPKGTIKQKTEQSQRCYLTNEELQAMIAAPCPNVEVKKAFIFSCLTGLRFSDVQKLRSEDVSVLADGTAKMELRQQKTGQPLWLDLTSEALSLLNLSTGAKCFDLIQSSAANIDIKKWAAAAGVKKNVTFHVARHTFATLMLTQGVDIYTVSKLLGHSSVTTTQIYAKVIDATKREALSRLSNLINQSQTSNKNGLINIKNEESSNQSKGYKSREKP